MKKILIRVFQAVALLSVLSLSVFAQQVKRAPFDVTNYVMDVSLTPLERKINATVDVTFTPLDDTRNITFELNGSLKVDSITRIGATTTVTDTVVKPGVRPPTRPSVKAASTPGLSFIQDQAGVADIGPNVRIDLGETAIKGTPITLRFKYNGILELPVGGPLLTKRLAYIGTDQGYLMYAARWFPFHDYAADLATSDVTISLPGGLTPVGYSDMPVAPSGGKYRYVQSRPSLVGNFAYGKYQSKSLRFGDYELQFFTRSGNNELISRYGETLGSALQFYSKSFGAADTAKKLNIIEIDNDSLDFYSAQGMLFIANRQFEEGRDVTVTRLQREAALQWWGLTVGLKSFDDVWLSQGLAEYSAVMLRESVTDAAKLEDMRRELLEKALTFEQTASLLRAPANLDDQSIAYQYIMFGKGAFVFKLLRDTLGADKFDLLLKTYLAEYRGKSASIDDFEKLASRIAGQPMRYFFARWVEGTGVPEFNADYQIIRTKGGKFITRGTVSQNYDNLRLPLELQLRSEGEAQSQNVTVNIEDASADFNIESTGKPLAVIIDPNYKILRISPDLRVSSIARRGIEQFKEGNYVEAQTQFEAALKLDRSNAWIYYHLGLLFLEQRNYDLAIDNFKAARDLGNQGAARPMWLHVWSEIKMGNAYDAKGDRTRAVGAYKRAETIGDNYDNAQDAVKRYQASPFDPKEKQNTAVIK
ncbi:MAG TPA: M1 family aminopeptidase [Pyrinomonadaceae bacterium]|nr:tetratricopeptide repeat protein [Chloracidobacterium sp.]MBP9934379.1 tetratricopeptide repeat protein [Pyrinomonadaceae bacterium]MBK7801425.1 tetratricopeptide repeat protein [Chloracidobacterium sp.]MBK9436744.1 tetratricopeptide repeat protein [Chloracidobacterium sp.]MBL0241735.1 tetratricopeptide repeat protein [Chloracidobacterium sp.]